MILSRPPFVLGFYICRQFLKSLLFMLLGLTFALLLFDVLANADTVLEERSDIMKPLFQYMLLRLPAILVLAIPLSILMTGLTFFARMVSRQEIIAIRAAGFSVFNILVYLGVLVLFVAILHFLLADLVISETSQKLRHWENQGYSEDMSLKDDVENHNWFFSDGMYSYVNSVSADGNVLYNVTVIETAEDGDEINRIIKTNEANYVYGQWRLKDVTIFEPGKTAKISGEMLVKLPFKPSTISLLSETQSELSYAELVRVKAQDKVSVGQASQQSVWLHSKFSKPLAAIIMLLLAAPMALQIPRRNKVFGFMFGSILAGFSYFVIERLLLSFAENSLLPAVVAAWSPLILYSLILVWLLLLLEGDKA